jgi:Flp pilus assembly protein CpaB
LLKPKQKSVMVSILIGVVGFIGAYLTGHAGVPRESDILVAARDIQPGQPIDAGSVTVVPVRGQAAPTLLTKGDLEGIVGRTVDYEIPAGTPISRNDIADQPQRDGLDQDQVGVWLPVNLENGGDVMPGDRVDIFTSTNNAVSASGRPALAYVRVVRSVNSSGADLDSARQVNTIGATPVSSPGVPAAVEVAVTPAQASELASLMQSSHLILALSPWPPDDAGSAATTMAPGNVGPGLPSAQTGQPAQGQARQQPQPAQGGQGAAKQ